MSFTVAAFYRFAALPDCAEIRPELEGFCAANGIKGTILLAHEGINGTVAAEPVAIEALLALFAQGELFGGRLAGIDVKLSSAAAMPFRRLKVKLKREIVTLGVEDIDPTTQAGTYVDPADWNKVISDPDVLVIDTRNRFEVAMGSFEGAVDPETRKFSQFPDYVSRSLDPSRHKRVAMFCTGGIRCEKASAYMRAQGFSEVLHLKGGILRYLEEVPAEESLFRGTCFVFDERIALGPGLAEAGPAAETDL
ncbi:rhodanese-related sulfurtransferase [Mesorhizobium sp. BR1-1-16]|uniref:oxygen-dependent tRNA uridine(34) hydroxylase TrhO n=1 Tax=Mesorhizobium sp. BR1-1-16 TaxID=2876653 RepID=UPI001CCE4666|nr:rhodanese-related sulfurtransferase [Mesorhizobium sp. BR1-1-16]MBZ9935160.1 rhodanese-related sulfurtransferase [Mesorhizobium sp. BR1-1-16]